jgi:heme-degrading monooxygenase HmoA
MLCAMTQRKLKPGSFDDFRAAFVPGDEMEAPPGWKKFYAVRSVADENEVITFGFFDGSLDELKESQQTGEYDERRAAADQFVESVGVDGLFEVIEEREMN